jgi:hypothetical protein
MENNLIKEIMKEILASEATLISKVPENLISNRRKMESP